MLTSHSKQFSFSTFRPQCISRFFSNFEPQVLSHPFSRSFTHFSPKSMLSKEIMVDHTQISNLNFINNDQFLLEYIKNQSDDAFIQIINNHFDEIKNSKHKELKIFVISCIKTLLARDEIKFSKFLSELCLNFPASFRDGLKYLQFLADHGDLNAADQFATLSIITNYFNIRPFIPYLKMSKSQRSKAILDLFENASMQSIQKIADTLNDPVANSFCIFADIHLYGQTKRIDSLYSQLIDHKLTSEPWTTTILNSIGKMCIGINDRVNAYRFLNKAYENGSHDNAYFLSFLKYSFDKNRNETFKLIQQSYEMNIDSNEYNITQKYALMLLNGDGCLQNPKLAAQILSNKENKGIDDEIALGICLIRDNEYEKGIGILKEAAEFGDRQSKKIYGFYLLYPFDSIEQHRFKEAKEYFKMVEMENDQEVTIILDKLERGEKICEKDITLNFDDSLFLN